MENNAEQEARRIREMINEYVIYSSCRLNPDTKIVDRVIDGLLMRKVKFGHAYCPCRLVTGDRERDKKIICPCVYHIDEIEREGECHCNLFVSVNYQAKVEKGEEYV